MTFSIYWLYLLLAVFAEVIGTAVLKLSNGFENLYYGSATVALYALSTFLLAKSIVAVPVSVAYAVWAGVGILAISIIGYFVFDEGMSWLKFTAIAMILTGVVILNVITDA